MTFLPRSASPPFLKSFPFSRIFFSPFVVTFSLRQGQNGQNVRFVPWNVSSLDGAFQDTPESNIFILFEECQREVWVALLKRTLLIK